MLIGDTMRARRVATASSAHGGKAAVLQLLSRPKELTSVFQPIVSLRHGKLLGFEALLRFAGGAPFRGPAEAFDAAAAAGRLVDFEVAALDTHLAAARGLRTGGLFLNLSAPSFLDRRMRVRTVIESVVRAGFSPGDVVFELTELVRVDDMASFGAAIQPLRDAGFLLAVDDFGAGFTNLRLLVELAPDFVKVDRSLVQGVAVHPRKRVFLESLGTLGRRLGCAVIAEGLEEQDDVEQVAACGIAYAQGYSIGPPAAAPSRPRARVARVHTCADCGPG